MVGGWSKVFTPPSGECAIFLQFVRPTTPTISLVMPTLPKVQLGQMIVADLTGYAPTQLGGTNFVSDFFANSDGYVSVNLVQNTVAVSPTAVTVNIYVAEHVAPGDELQVSNLGDGTLTLTGVGALGLNIAKTTFHRPGVYQLEWIITMPDTTVLTFYVSATVDSNIR